MAGEHDGVAGDACAGADDGGHQGGVLVIVGRVGLGIDAGIGADDGALADGDAAAIVEQDALANGDAVANGEVVAVGKIDAVMDFDSRAHVVKDMAAQHATETQTQPVVEADGRAVKHLPEPEEGLAPCKALAVDLGEVAGFEGNVFRIERKTENVAWQLGREGEIELSAVWASQIELIELVADNLRAALRRTVANELIVEKLEPAAIDFFRFGRGMGNGAGLGRHTLWTIHQTGGLHRIKQPRRPEVWDAWV